MYCTVDGGRVYVTHFISFHNTIQIDYSSAQNKMGKEECGVRNKEHKTQQLNN